MRKKRCEDTCVGYKQIGLEACLGCAGERRVRYNDENNKQK